MQTQLTFSPEAFPASPSVPPASGREPQTPGTSGRKCLEQFERFDRVGLWAKTFAALLIGMEGWYSTRCKLTWKLRGTKSSRFYYQLVPSMLPTEGTGFGLLPTVQTQGLKICVNGKTVFMPMGLLPTPTATSDAKGGCMRGDPKRQQDTLAHAIHAMTGSPSGKTSQLNPLFVAEMMGFPPNWTELPFQSGGNGRSSPTETP